MQKSTDANRAPCQARWVIHNSSSATCPMCHTPASVTQIATNPADGWRCVRCGQHWDARRFAGVAAYAAWTADHDRRSSESTADSDAVSCGEAPAD